MAIKIGNRRIDGVAVIDASGRITFGEGGVTLRDAIHELLEKGEKKILLNMGEVTYMDSSGVGELVGAFAAVQKLGGELKLLNLTKRIKDLLQITKLYTVFDVKEDESAAVAAFN